MTRAQQTMQRRILLHTQTNKNSLLSLCSFPRNTASNSQRLMLRLCSFDMSTASINQRSMLSVPKVEKYVQRISAKSSFLDDFIAKRIIKIYYGHALKKHLKNMETMERRLYVILHRLGFAFNLSQARHYILRGLVKVNGTPLKQPTHVLNVGDKVSMIKPLN